MLHAKRSSKPEDLAVSIIMRPFGVPHRMLRRHEKSEYAWL